MAIGADVVAALIAAGLIAGGSKSWKRLSQKVSVTKWARAATKQADLEATSAATVEAARTKVERIATKRKLHVPLTSENGGSFTTVCFADGTSANFFGNLDSYGSFWQSNSISPISPANSSPGHLPKLLSAWSEDEISDWLAENKEV